MRPAILAVHRGVVGVLLLALLFVGSTPYLQAATKGETVFAEVNGQEIGWAEFNSAVHMAARQRFFHRGAAEGKLDALRVEVARGMIDRILLLEEARRRGISVDSAALDKGYDQALARFRGVQLSAENRLELRHQVEDRLLLGALEQEVKSVPDPTDAEVRSFYERHLDKFTTPAQGRVSVILLNVAPSSSTEVWQAAHDEAAKLYAKLQNGADFAELASIHSADSSADRGGDLGFVHRGMLSAQAQEIVDGLDIGEVSEPVALLQGVALFRLTERKPAEVNPFERVAQRAASLLKRERSEKAWEDLVQALRAKAKIVVHEGALEKQIINGYVPAADY